MDALNECATEVPVAPVVRALVPEDARMGCLPRHFGYNLNIVENGIYDVMGQLCADYEGGYWNYYELSSGGFYMAPSTDAPCVISQQGNGFHGALTSDAAGIIACALVYSRLGAMLHDQKLYKAFYQLRDFALQHEESHLIFAALD